MKTIELSIKGMHCRSCETLIKEALEEQNGIESAVVSHTKGNAVIIFNPEKIKEDEIKNIINKEGYEA